jgi:hypothetical protein
VRATIHKQTYADGRAYRYRISDEAGDLCYVAEPTGLLLPSPTHLVEFFDPDHHRVGRLQPPEVARWRREKHYTLFVGQGTEEPYAVIRERWRLVDMLLLRLPRYDVQLGGDCCYVVRGSRYGERFYEIFCPHPGPEEKERGGEKAAEGIGRSEETGAHREDEPRSTEIKAGQIQRPTVGPSYIVETDATLLHQAPLVLAALVVLIDLELYA